MKQILMIVLWICAISFTIAQDIKISFSALQPVSKTTRILAAHRIGKKIFVIRSHNLSNKVMSLLVYDAANLELKQEKVFKDYTCKGGDCIDSQFSYLESIFLKNSIILFFNSFETSKKEHWLFAQRIDLKGNFIGKLVKIDKISATKQSNPGSFILKISEDSTRFAVIGNPPYDKYAGEKFGFKVYDGELNNTSNASLSLPKKDKDVSLIDYFLGNDGKIFILTKIDLEKKERERGSAPFYYSVYIMTPDKQDITEYIIDLPKKNLEDVAIRLNADQNEVFCAGFYSDIKHNAYTGDDIDGFFYLTFDVNTWQTKVSGTKKIDKRMIADLQNRKKVKEGRGIDKSFDILKLSTSSDGTTTIIAENRYMRVHSFTTMSNGVTSRHETYHYFRNSIFLITVENNGNVLSVFDVPKTQHTIDDWGFYSSVLIIDKKDRIILVYNDHPDNLSANVKSLKQITPMMNVRKAVLVAVEVFKDGTYSKTKLSDNATSKITLIPEQGFIISHDEYCIPSILTPAGCSCACLQMMKKTKMGLAKIEL